MTLPPRLTRFLQRLKADANKGSAAIEFAMVAPIFFILLMGTIEAGVIFFGQSVLQNAVNDTARLVRTGQTACYTTSGGNCVAMTQAQFRTKLCSYGPAETLRRPPVPWLGAQARRTPPAGTSPVAAPPRR